MLKGSRCYLAGAMDRVPDGGHGWRDNISEFLSELGVIPMNPCKKPILYGREDEKNRSYINRLKKAGRYDEVAEFVKEFRCIDLRMVDVSDFVILNVDTAIHMCGSYEELTLANRQKKPVLIHVEQGKEECPNWIFGMIPHEHIFSSWVSLQNYLIDVNDNDIRHKRWILFNYEDLK